MNEDKGCNGYANYETWNIATWIENDESLYLLALMYQRHINPYLSFIHALEDLDGDIRFKTPDGIAWNDPSLDIHELNAMIEEL